MESLRRSCQFEGKVCVRDFLKQFFILFIAATALNYPWELAQASLYVGMESWTDMKWHCFVASMGDGVLIWTIFAIGWAVFKRVDWYMRLSIHTFTLMLTLGLGIGVSVEWMAVNVLGRWQYTPKMPVFPALNVGLVPLLQMVLLPPVIFQIAAWCTAKRHVRLR
jgi:hypothetical protein